MDKKAALENTYTSAFDDEVEKLACACDGSPTCSLKSSTLIRSLKKKKIKVKNGG